MNEEEIKKKLLESEEGLKSLYSKGKLEDAPYFKLLLTLAHDFATHKELMKAAELIRACTDNYFNQDLAAQCQEDAAFVDIVYALAKSFVDAGMINLEQSFIFNRPPALA
jgi:hypothetical protein